MRTRQTAPATPATAWAPGADAPGDEARRRGLRRMQAVALSLLVLAAVVYLLTHGEDGVLGFVNAAAEASMVGAVADWFAVTALFRHPLGLPVPHTALVPRRKDELGESLQEFVAGNFLAEPVVRERVTAATPAHRVGEWLAEERHVRRVVDEGCDVAAAALARVRDDHVADLARDVLVPRLRTEPVVPLLGSLLTEVVRDDLHHPVVDLVLDELHRWLVSNPGTVTEILTRRAPWWTPPRLDEVVTARIHAEATAWVAEIRADPGHHARAALDSLLGQLARDLLLDDDTRARTEALKERLLEHPQAVESGIALWNALRQALLPALREPDGVVRDRLRTELSAFGERLRTDAALRRRLDAVAVELCVSAVERYGTELTSVISHTVQRWDGREASRRIELHVGRDLQFIRINGTVVGGLVGVAIHTVSVLVT